MVKDMDNDMLKYGRKYGRKLSWNYTGLWFYVMRSNKPNLIMSFIEFSYGVFLAGE